MKSLHFLLSSILAIHLPLFCDDEEGENLAMVSPSELVQRIHMPKGHVINFENVSISEFIRFVSKIAGANFVYNKELMNFNITLVSGKPTSPEHVLSMLIRILEQHNLFVKEHDDYFLIQTKEDSISEIPKNQLPPLNLMANAGDDPSKFLDQAFDVLHLEKEKFFVYKLQFHQGGEIQQAIKQLAGEPGGKMAPKLLRAIGSMQWIKATNSLLYSGNQESIDEVSELIGTLDIAQKQVFIEVLVIETDMKSSLDFGLEWAGKGKFLDRIGLGAGNFAPGPGISPLANTVMSPGNALDVPIGKGFDLGVIGDIIWHKGKTFLTLSSLVSALQIDGNSTIVLNQKLITQDNKSSSIFVGDNIPFTGSVVQTVGASQQTTSNIEYRDVGVSLNITPLLGDGNIITLDISEEISEATNSTLTSVNQSSGIQTTKTNMLTRAHVPDQHFLVLSGMIRNTKKTRKSGIPCLGGLPWIGAAFSKNEIENEKRNIIVFVRPQIINSIEQYEQITAQQEKIYEMQAPSKEAYDKGLELIKGDTDGNAD